MTATNTRPSASQLLRVPYLSTATGAEREFLLYLPTGYDDEPNRRWPVLFFLHGGGERGDGKLDLDYVLVHGPLGEAWIRHHDLPFVMVGPQLPVFDMDHQVAARTGIPSPCASLHRLPRCPRTARPAPCRAPPTLRPPSSA